MKLDGSNGGCFEGEGERNSWVVWGTVTNNENKNGGSIEQRYTCFQTKLLWVWFLIFLEEKIVNAGGGGGGQEKIEKIYRWDPSLVSPKCADSLPKWTKMCQFLAVARKMSIKFLAGSCWREQIWFFHPRNSRETPPCPDVSHQTVSREKNTVALTS